jgi:putative FmdB family regulatory protein
MPLYEYWCNQCQEKVLMYKSTFVQDLPLCPVCSENILQRLFSTFSVRKTDNDIYESILGDSQLTSRMLKNDPAALAEWNKRMSRNEKIAPEYEEMVNTMKKGEMPTKSIIDKTKDKTG